MLAHGYPSWSRPTTAMSTSAISRCARHTCAAGRIYLSGPAAQVRRAQREIADVLIAVVGRDHEG